MTARPATLLLLASVFLLIPTKSKEKIMDDYVSAEERCESADVAYEAVTVALVELHDALIALETI